MPRDVVASIGFAARGLGVRTTLLYLTLPLSLALVTSLRFGSLSWLSVVWSVVFLAIAAALLVVLLPPLLAAALLLVAAIVSA